MSLLDFKVESGPKMSPPRIIVYGEHKMGKTTFAGMAPNPLFIQIEDGSDQLDVARLPRPEGYKGVIAQLQWVAEAEHNYQTLVIDSLDWLEKLVYQQVIADFPFTEKGKQVKDISDYGYGGGYEHALAKWSDDIIPALDYIRNKRQMMIIGIAHESIVRVNDPRFDPYDRHQLKLMDGKKVSVADLVMEWADGIFFVAENIVVKKEGSKPKDGSRFIYTSPQPSFVAGHRFVSMPDEIPFTKDGSAWNTLVEYIPYLSNKYLNKGE